MATFNLKNFLTENRNQVIEKYNLLTKEDTFNGISLRDFMMAVLRNMEANNPKSEKRAASLFSGAINNAYYDAIRVGVIIDRDAQSIAKYEGTAYMAIV